MSLEWGTWQLHRGTKREDALGVYGWGVHLFICVYMPAHTFMQMCVAWCLYIGMKR